MTRLGSHFGRRGVAFLLAGVVATALALAVPLARSSNDGGGEGGYGAVACSASGVTNNFGGIHQQPSPVCNSYRSGFSGFISNAPTNCNAYGYSADVYQVIGNQVQWEHPRWSSPGLCADGIWHVSSAWGYNERRISIMYINMNSVSFNIFQYSR
jgi:hypothetical protein